MCPQLTLKGLKLKTPSFWYRHETSPTPLPELLLSPLSWVYGVGHKINQARYYKEKVYIPVICVGNIVSGGSGKTPTALALMQLVAAGKIADKAHFLTRGYGGTEKGPHLVDYFKDQASDIGDESLLLAKTAFTVVSAHRPDGARYAQDHGADLVIMDDGLQNGSLHKDISIVVIDGAAGFGNKKLLPAGPLRETLEEGLAKADAFVLIGKDRAEITALLPEDKPVFQAHVKVPKDKKPATTKNYVAFAGLGRPEKFYHLLQKLNLNIESWHPFPDHYTYSDEDIAALSEEAKSKNAILITTEKDFLRLPEKRDDNIEIMQLPIELVWDNETAILDFLRDKLNSRNT